MAEAKQRENWTHTSELLAGFYNALLKPNRPFTAGDFNPVRVDQDPEPVMEAPITALRVFCG